MTTQESMPAQETMPEQEVNMPSQEPVPSQDLNRPYPPQPSYPPHYYNPPALSLDTITTVTMPVLYPGNNGEAVRFLQQLLLSCGYTILQFNANFDRFTYLAVIDFQRNNGLAVDGVVGFNTWRKLGEVMYSKRHRFC